LIVKSFSTKTKNQPEWIRMPRKSVSGHQAKFIITLHCTLFLTGSLSTAPTRLTLPAPATVEDPTDGI